jgi:arsenite methyltransferase
VDRLHRRRPKRAEFTEALEGAGFEAIEIIETHRVHEHAASAVVSARNPSS